MFKKRSPVIFFIAFLVASFSCSVKSEDYQENWIQLFNNKDLQGWDIKIRGYPLNENVGNTFRVEDGVLQVNYDQYEGWEEQYGHIFYKEKFSAYLLSLQYRFTGEQVSGGAGWAYRNSGAMLHAQPAETMRLNQDFPISIEAQFLGGDGSKARTTGNLCTPGTHVFLNDSLFTPHCVSSTSKTYHNDQWVTFEALVLGDSIIKHIVERDTVLVYEKPQIDEEDGKFNPELYKKKQLLKAGFIALQSESHPVEFRRIQLFNLEEYMSSPKSLQKVLHKLRNRKDHL